LVLWLQAGTMSAAEAADSSFYFYMQITLWTHCLLCLQAGTMAAAEAIEIAYSYQHTGLAPIALQAVADSSFKTHPYNVIHLLPETCRACYN
jgi:hypothetical protein